MPSVSFLSKSTSDHVEKAPELPSHCGPKLVSPLPSSSSPSLSASLVSSSASRGSQFSAFGRMLLCW